MRLGWSIAIVAAVGLIVSIALAVTPGNGGTVGGATVAVDVTAGDQLDPHVSGDIAAYTDAANPDQSLIRYYDFLTPGAPNAFIPTTADFIDTLSDVNGNHVAFARYDQSLGTRSCMIYDVVAHTTTKIGSGTQAFATALGGDTVAFVNGTGASDIMVGRISTPAAPLTNLSASPAATDTSPAVSPAGNLVVWTSCVLADCNVMKATLTSGTWSLPAVVRTSAANPDTDGTNIVYDSAGDVFFQPAGGGAATQLALSGVERNPSIAGGVIAFEGAVDAISTHDLFVYQISSNLLFRVTDTPSVDESLNDVTVLPNGDVRIVWAANDDAAVADARNIYARTFSLPQELPLPEYNFSGFFSPVENMPTLNIATAGSAIPVKFSLGGDQGLAIFAAGYPASSPITCDASDPSATIEETVNAGGSSLSYDANNDQYTYIWKTNKAWRGTCRMLVVGLNDRSQHLAKFRFR